MVDESVANPAQPTPADGAARPGFRKIVSGAGMLTGVRVLGDLTSALLFIAISRAFGAEGVGLYAYGFAIAQVVQNAVGFGLADYALREFARAPEPARDRVLGEALGLQGALTVVASLGLWLYLAATAATPEEAALIVIVTVYQVFYGFVLTLMIPSIVSQRMAGPALNELVFRIGGTAVAAATVTFLHLGLAPALLALPASGALWMAASAITARRQGVSARPRLDIDSALRTLSAAASFAGSTVVLVLYVRIGIILLVFLDGEAAAGIFAAGLKLVDVGMAPLLFLSVAVFPRLSGSFGHDHADLMSIADQYARVSIAFGAFVCWGMIYVATPLAPYLLGPDFVAAGPAVALMGVVALLTALDFPAYRLLWAARMQARRLWIQLAGLAVNVAVGAALIPFWGPYGAIAAAAATLVAMIALALGPLTRSLPSERWARLARDGAATLGATLACGLAAEAAGIERWIAAILTLAALAGASAASGLVRPGALLPGRRR